MLKTDLTNEPTYHIRIYRTGACRVKGQYAYRNYAKDRDHEYTIYIGIIKGNGITALVDTGMESVEEMNRGAGFLLSELIHQQPDEDTLSILKKADITLADVDYVFLTHCHYDHCSNLPLFSRAKVVIPAHAWKVWHTKKEGAIYLHKGFLEYLEFINNEGRLILQDNGKILPGIAVRWVGGHSPCSQFIYVNSTLGVVTFTGDAVQMYGNLEHNDSIGICVDDAQCWQALELVRSSSDILIPGHDPRVLLKYPDNVIA
jgi:glyoxylase-like metal-dependent hydrolase (beta-lactamase superfamily II)